MLRPRRDLEMKRQTRAVDKAAPTTEATKYTDMRVIKGAEIRRTQREKEKEEKQKENMKERMHKLYIISDEL